MSIIHYLLCCGEIQKFTTLNVCFGFSSKSWLMIYLFMCAIGLLDLKNISKDTKVMVIGVQGAKPAILNFAFLVGTIEMTLWFPHFLNSAYSKTPWAKFHAFIQKCRPHSLIRSTILQRQTNKQAKGQINPPKNITHLEEVLNLTNLTNMI